MAAFSGTRIDELRTRAARGDVAAETVLSQDLAQTFCPNRLIDRRPPKECVEAMNAIKDAASKNFAPAQELLGLFYYVGNTTRPDYPLAVHWFELAVEAKDPIALYDLGLMKEQGLGCTQDKEEAVRLYRALIDLDGPEASLGTVEYARFKAKQRLLGLGITVGPKLYTVMVDDASAAAASVYVDEKLQGTADASGHFEIHGLVLGDHTFKLVRAGYTDWSITKLIGTQPVTLQPKLTPLNDARTRRLTEAEVTTLLQNGLTIHRIESLVQERGVAFSYTNEVAARLRSAGATDELLAAIQSNSR